MICPGMCARCPFACNFKVKRATQQTTVQQAATQESINDQSEVRDQIESFDLVPQEVVPVYDVKKTLTGKLKGVLKG